MSGGAGMHRGAARTVVGTGVRRLGSTVVTALGAAVGIWSLLPLARGDVARLTLQAQGVAEPAPDQVAAVRSGLGLDRPLPAQFATWLGRLMTGDLGTSFRTGRPVSVELADRIGPTLRLGVTALLLAAAIAVPAGIVGAWYRDRWPDGVTRMAAITTAAVPEFVTGLVVITVLVVGLGLGTVVTDGSWSQVGFPALVLALGLVDTWARLLRSAMVDTLASSFVLTARARGSTPGRILCRHVLPASLSPLVHAVAVAAGTLWGGAAIVETVFTWPGLGSYVVSAVKARDLPVVQAFAVLATAAYVGASLLADAVGALLEPERRR